MTAIEQHRLGKALWAIADRLRGSMMADDFRDYMLSFIFLRYLSEQYEEAVKKELGSDYPEPSQDVMTKLKVNTPLQIWYEENPGDIVDFEQQMRRKAHYVILPKYLWGNIVELARTQDKELLDTLEKGFKYIEEQSFDSSFRGLFSEINLHSDKLGKTYEERNTMLCKVVTEIANGISEFSTSTDSLGDAYEYLIGEFAANGFENPLPGKRGNVFAGRYSDNYNSQNSQFFINQRDIPELEGYYAGFGTVVKGMEEVDRLSHFHTYDGEHPDKPEVITRMYLKDDNDPIEVPDKMPKEFSMRLKLPVYEDMGL